MRGCKPDSGPIPAPHNSPCDWVGGRRQELRAHSGQLAPTLASWGSPGPRLTTRFWFLLALSGALDLSLLLFVLRFRALRIGLVRLALALSAGALFAALKAPVFVLAAHSFFFAASLGWTTLVVVTPLTLLHVALRREATRAVRSVALAGALLLPALGWYGTFYEPFRLVEERHDVPIDPRNAPSEPLRIAVLADIQSQEVDAHLREAVRRAMAFEPHLIVLPGDLIQIANKERYLAAAPQFRELLAPLAAPLGVYFVIGNTDTPSLVRHALEGTNVHLLVDETAEVEFAGKRVLIGGATIAHWRENLGQSFSRAFDRREGDELRILVCHYPSCVEEAEPGRNGFDLAIAGHTHGGQVVIPGFGPPVTLTSVPRAAAAGGLHIVNGRQLYVSRGVGLERGTAPRLRFLCPPEVSLLTLRAAD